MSERPFLRHTIAQLEELFATAPGDENRLKSLQDELQHRQVPRAVSLLAKVRASQNGEHAPEPFALRPQPTPPSQPELFTAPTPKPAPPVRAVGSKPVEAAQIETMSLEDAFKTLRVTASTPWPEIEKARRELVQKAHPDNVADLSAEKRSAIQTYAKLANLAFAVLHKSRLA